MEEEHEEESHLSQSDTVGSAIVEDGPGKEYEIYIKVSF